jgi:integrase
MEATNSLRWHPGSGCSTPVGPEPAAWVEGPAAAGAARPRRQQTLRQWLDEWLRLCSNRELRATTVEGYATTLRLYVPRELAAKELSSVRSDDLNELYASLLRRGRRDGSALSSRTVRYLHTILNRALSDAVRAGAILTNPAASAAAPSRRSTRPPAFDFWSPAELAQFLDSARDDSLYVAFALAAATGLRRSELLALRWCDIDLDASELRVVQALVRVQNSLRIAPPKTERSRRPVALDSATAELLRRYRALAEAPPRAFDDHGFVFHKPGGEPIHPALFSDYFQRRTRLAGVRPIRFHDLRHTHATHALQAGVHPKIVSERLGHSTVTITLDTYSHVLPGLQREAAEAVAALVRGGGS